ncbi:MAG: GNAT family N-acetyltransferase [Acidithiobacillus sp.]
MRLINVSPALEHDIDVIASLAEACALQGSIKKQPSGYRGFIESIVRNGAAPAKLGRAKCFVTRINKGRDIAGFSVLREIDSRTLELWIVCVATGEQRKSYGESFVKHAMDYACAVSASLCARCSSESSQGIISLLEKLDFEEGQPDGSWHTFIYPPRFSKTFL